MKYITPSIAVTILVLVVGCSTTGLPPGARVVGGGLQIRWAPPEDGGTAILFEQTTGKTVATETVGKDFPFTFDVTSESCAEALKTVFPTPPTNAHFVLYYVPPRKR